jgi:hypothetical protein
MMPRTLPTLVLLALAGALAGASGCGRTAGPTRKTLPSDEHLIAFFQAHRAGLDSLRANDQATMRYGPNDRDPKLWAEWTRLIRQLGLPGGGAIEDTGRIFIPADGRALSRELVDTKGFAWLDSPSAAVFETLPNLDALDDQALEKPSRHIRHLDGHWWLYRWIGERDED